MKNRKMIAIILAVAMMGIINAPSLAAVNTIHTQEATKLQILGLMAGGLADQNLDQQMTRLQGLIFAIKAAGKASEVDLITDSQVRTALGKYTDSSNIPTYGKKFMAYAIINNITTGIGNNKLGSLNPISGTSFLVFLLKTGMGYGNANTANIIDMAFGANVITFDQKDVYSGKPILIRDDAAVILYKAVMDGVNDSGEKFIDSLIKSGFVSQAVFDGIKAETPEDAGAAANGALTVEEIAKNKDNVVFLTNNDSSGKAESFGSGFIISTDGRIVTNYHVIEGAASMNASFPDGRVFSISSVLAFDKAKDLAVIQASGLVVSKALTLGDSGTVAEGQQVVAIGNPEGLQNTVSTGIVSSIRFNSLRNANDLQITAPISPGSSGGPLFNMKGEVIGVNYAGLSVGQNLNFSIPVSDLKPLLQNLSPKTFAQVYQEANPELASLNTTCSTLMTKYGTITVNGKTIKLDYYDLLFKNSDPSSNMIYHYIGITDSESIINYLSCLTDPALESQLGGILVNAMRDVSAAFPGMDQFGGIEISFSTDEYPAYGLYDTVRFNPSTNLWEVSDTSLFFDEYGGEYEYWLDTD